MGALRIAFDATIVGVLALPWMVFAADLLFLQKPNDDNKVKSTWTFVKKSVQSAVGGSTVVGVILFAVTYFLGSAITRTAQDFFNDDDLIHVWPMEHLIRFWPTEDNIRTAEYCDEEPKIPDTFKFEEIAPSVFHGCPKAETEEAKWGTSNYWLGRLRDNYSDDLVNATQRVFRLQESALLLNGEDKTERLRQLHDEIMVLRGAAFDALLAAIFCLFCWWARQRQRVRQCLRLVPLALLAIGFGSLRVHFQESSISEAPFMEIAVILLGAAGLRGLYKGENREWYGHSLFLLMLLFFVVAYLGWWRTEVLYSRQVIYSFYAQRYVPK